MARLKETRDLIRDVYHPRSNGYKAITALAARFEAGNNINGTSLLNRILFLMKQKGIVDFSGVLERRYVRKEEAARHERFGVADTSGQRCRRLHVVDLRAYARDGSIKAAASVAKGTGNTVSVGELHVGSNVLETLDEILDSGFDPMERENRKKTKDGLLAGLARADSQYDDVFGRITGHPELADTYRRMLEFGPLHAGKDLSVLRVLADPQALRSDLAWLKASLKTMPMSVVMAYYNHIGSRKTSPEDAATLIAAVQQFKQQKSEALIGGFRKDVLYLEKLADDDALFGVVRKPVLDEKFETLRIVKDAVLPKQNVTRRKKLDEKFLTIADALSLYRSVPGIDAARRTHNDAVADRYCSPQEFPSLYEKAVETMSAERERIAEVKKHKEQVTYTMPKKEYITVKYADDLVTLAREGARTALVRLTPMKYAEETFRTITLVGRKAKSGLPQTSAVVLRQDVDFSDEDLDRLGRTLLNATKLRYLAGRANCSLRTLVAAQEAARQGDNGLLPTAVASLDTRLRGSDRGEFIDGLRQAEPLGETRQDIDYLLALRDSPIQLDALGRTAASGRKTTRQSDPRFDITAFRDVAYLMPSDKEAVKRVANECRHYIGAVDPAALTACWKKVEEAVAAGARFYTVETDFNQSCRVQEVKPLSMHKRLIEGLNYRAPREMQACIDALANKVARSRKDIERVREVQRRRAPGWDTGLAALMTDTDAYLLPEGSARIQKTVGAIKQGNYPVHATDALDPASVQVYNALPKGRQYRSFAVEVRSESAKPWLDVLNVFSKKRGGIGTPERFEWQFDDDFRKCRLYSEGVLRATVTETMDKVARHNLKTGSKVYLSLRALE